MMWSFRAFLVSEYMESSGSIHPFGLYDYGEFNLPVVQLLLGFDVEVSPGARYAVVHTYFHHGFLVARRVIYVGVVRDYMCVL